MRKELVESVVSLVSKEKIRVWLPEFIVTSVGRNWSLSVGREAGNEVVSGRVL